MSEKLFKNLVKLGNQNPQLQENISPILHHLNQSKEARSKRASDVPKEAEIAAQGLMEEHQGDRPIQDALFGTVSSSIGGMTTNDLFDYLKESPNRNAFTDDPGAHQLGDEDTLWGALSTMAFAAMRRDVQEELRDRGASFR